MGNLILAGVVGTITGVSFVVLVMVLSLLSKWISFAAVGLHLDATNSAAWMIVGLTLLMALFHSILPFDFRRNALSTLLMRHQFGVNPAGAGGLQSFGAITRSLVWALLSCLMFSFGAIVGIEAAVLELVMLAVTTLPRGAKLFLEERRTLYATALACVLSVVLGAPIAAAIFALEMLQDYDTRLSSAKGLALQLTVVLGSLLAYALSVSLLSVAQLTSLNPLHPMIDAWRLQSLPLGQWFLIAFVGLWMGALAALVGVVFSSFISRIRMNIESSFPSNGFIRILSAGALIAILAYFIPEAALEGSMNSMRAWEAYAPAEIATIAVTRTLFLILAIAFWNSAGFFTPLFFLGGLLGSMAGNSLSVSLVPPLAIMGGLCAVNAVFRAPIALSVLAFELSRSGSLWLVATSSLLVSAVVMRFFRVQTLLEYFSRTLGLVSMRNRGAKILDGLKVEEVLSSDVQVIPEDADMGTLKKAIEASRGTFLGVVRADQKFVGLLALEQLPEVLLQSLSGTGVSSGGSEILGKVLEIRDLMTTNVPFVFPSESCLRATVLLAEWPCVPVVDADRHLLGLVYAESIQERYKRELILVGAQISRTGFGSGLDEGRPVE